MTTTALILGGGRWQLGLISSAKMLGLGTIVADISPNAPGRALADQFVQIDTNDRVGLKKLAEQVKPQLILADQTDRLVPIAGYLNDSFDLPGISEKVAERFTNKFTMRQALENSGIPMPAYRVVRSLQEANEAIPYLGMPVIVKPLQSQSSVGVRLVTAVDQLASAYATASAVGGPSVLIEQFIDGVEITVESVSLNGRCSVLAISEKAHYAHNPCVARLLAYPPRFPNATLDRIRKTARAVVEILGLETGLSHAEYRVREEIPYLVEVAARGGGNGIASTIVPHVSGVDTYSVVIRNLLGDNALLPQIQSRAAILEFFDFAAGQIDGIDGISECLKRGLAKVIDVPYSAGDWVRAAEDDRNRPGYFIALGENREEVDLKSSTIKDLVRVRYAQQVAM